MPTYSYKCGFCEHDYDEIRKIVARNNPGICPQCGKVQTYRVYIYGGCNIEVFKPMVYTNITDHDILIESKKQLKNECKKHGVRAARLM